MTFSLNEVQATARKAAKGAGYTWGVADEVGQAVHWLCGNGVDGCAALAMLLRQMDDNGFACPIKTGCALADHDQQAAHIGVVTQPLLLMPFVAMVARRNAVLLALTCGSARAVTDGASLSLQGTLTGQGDMTISATTEFGTQLERTSRASPHSDDWACLNSFAHRTYAPATEESRRKGAG